MKHHENGGVFKKPPVSPAPPAPAKTCLSSGKAAAALADGAYRGVREHDKVARMQLADFFNTPSMNPTIFSMQIPACADAAEIAVVLDCPEFLGAWEQDDTLVMYWQGKEEDIVPQMQVALQHFDVQLPDGAIRIQRVKDEDWNAQWAASVTPLRVGRRIGIRPSWGVMDMPKDGIELVLDPKQAFGTGHHATTQLLLEWLEELTWVPGMRVLDVWTGSGILSMVALRLGATHALAIDVDARALECAREYAEINGFQGELELRCCPIEELPTQAFDMIVANLDRNTILQVSCEFSRMQSPRTQLFLSGLLVEDESDIVGQLEAQGWVRRHVRERAGWLAIQLVGSSFSSSPSG
jgi:ribosomal protein L11 methyltransferase